MMGDFGYYHMMDFGLGGVMMWILVILVLGIVLYAVTRDSRSTGDGIKQTDQPLDILKRRYARGEISREEFQLQKKDLEE